MGDELWPAKRYHFRVLPPSITLILWRPFCSGRLASCSDEAVGDMRDTIGAVVLDELGESPFLLDCAIPLTSKTTLDRVPQYDQKTLQRSASNDTTTLRLRTKL